MNEHQAHLLKLVKEIDGICRRHDIRYYSAGGTVIGAARHKGFIPWDDDIDIYMTRDEFARFCKAFYEERPEGRSIVFRESEECDYHSTIARYIEDDTTMFCRYHMLGDSPAGTLIDIFILDPIPDGMDARHDYLEKFFVYCDIVMPFYSFAHRVREENMGLYDTYYQRLKTEGYDAVVEDLEKDLFSYPEEECNYYALRWGSIPTVFPKEMMGEPVYLPFEDEMLPMPNQWYQYLVLLYGTEWMKVPYVDTRVEHTNITRYDMSYKRFYEERDRLFTQDFLSDLYFQNKEARRGLEKAYRPIENYMSDFKGKITERIVDKRIDGRDLYAMLDAGEYSEIIHCFQPYLQLQLSRPFMGAMRHGNYLRWIYPIILSIQDSNLNVLLQALIRCGRIGEAEKLTGIYERGDVSREAIKASREDIDRINRAGLLFFEEDYDGCIRCIEEKPGFQSYRMLLEYWWQAKVRKGLDAGEVEELQALAEAQDAPEGLQKAWGDYLYQSGEKEKAEVCYNRLMENSRNGLFWMDISTKFEIPEMSTEAPTVFIKDSVTEVEEQLMGEIATFCNTHDIKYVVSPKLSRRMFLTGNIGYTRIAGRIIYMDAENADKFLREFEREPIPHRKLVSWLNDDTVRDFTILYTDDNSIFADFRRLEEWHGVGLRVTIRILRSSNSGFIHQKQTYYGEFLMNLMHLEEVDNRLLNKSRKKRLALSVLNKTVGRNVPKAFHDTFANSLEKEKKAKKGGDYYFIHNLRGKRPQNKHFRASDYDDTLMFDMDGVSYRIPKAVTEQHFRNEPSLSNAPSNPSIFLYSSDEISWDEVDDIIDMEGYKELDWVKYEEARIYARDMQKKNRIPWNCLLRKDSVINLEAEYEPLLPEIREKMEKGDMDEVGGLMADLDLEVKRFSDMGLLLKVDQELMDLYLEYLDRSSQDRFAEKIRTYITEKSEEVINDLDY